MKQINKKKLILFTSVVLVLFLAVAGYYGLLCGSKPEYITILHTNDVHGRLESFAYKDNEFLMGGIARRATLIKQIESTNKCAFTVDSGDIAQGSLFFNMYKGVPDTELMSEAGYDVATLGNHEFDKGLTFLKNMIKHATFPFVSSNIKFTEDEELQKLIKPYVIKDCYGLKVAFLGLVPDDLEKLSSTKGVEIISTEESLKKSVKKLNSKADLIVVLSHAGFKTDKKLARAVPEVDVIVGGHSHTLVEKPKVYNSADDKTLVLQAGELGAYLGRLDIKIKDKEIKNYYYDLIPVDERIEPDKIINAKVSVLAGQNDRYTGEIIGQLAVPIGIQGDKIRSKLIPAGSLVTEAIKYKFPDVDLALQNSGGIRPYKHLGPGAITLADIMRLLPFDNSLVTLELKGEDLKSVLETSSSEYPADNGGFLQSLGLEYTLNINEHPGNRVSNILVNGKPLKYDKYYKIAINDYMFKGGNGYEQFKNANNIVKTGITTREAVLDYIRENSPVVIDVKDKININIEQSL